MYHYVPMYGTEYHLPIALASGLIASEEVWELTTWFSVAEAETIPHSGWMAAWSWHAIDKLESAGKTCLFYWRGRKY